MLPEDDIFDVETCRSLIIHIFIIIVLYYEDFYHVAQWCNTNGLNHCMDYCKISKSETVPSVFHDAATVLTIDSNCVTAGYFE